MASKGSGNFVVQGCRFFVRHPARVLFILLLILLILLSRILQSPHSDKTASSRLSDYRSGEPRRSGLSGSGPRTQYNTAFSVAGPQAEEDSYNVLMTLVKVGRTSPLARGFRRCVKSICLHASVALSFHVVADEVGKLTTQDVFSAAAETCEHNISVTYYSVETVDSKLGSYTKQWQVQYKHIINEILWCTTVHNTTVHNTILYYTILYYTILYYTILYCTTLHYTILDTILFHAIQ